MKEHRFVLAITFASGVKSEEVVLLPEDLTDAEVEEEFKEWVWNQLDAYRVELPEVEDD